MDSKLISHNVNCPYCNRSLMDYNKFIKGQPSTKLYVKSGDYSGILNLCSLYGCYELRSEIKLYNGEITDIYCPECNKNLKSRSVCNICNAPTVNLKLVTGGILRVCTRVNCKKHSVIFEDIFYDLPKYFIRHDYRAR